MLTWPRRFLLVLYIGVSISACAQPLSDQSSPTEDDVKPHVVPVTSSVLKQQILDFAAGLHTRHDTTPAVVERIFAIRLKESLKLDVAHGIGSSTIRMAAAGKVAEGWRYRFDIDASSDPNFLHTLHLAFGGKVPGRTWYCTIPVALISEGLESIGYRQRESGKVEIASAKKLRYYRSQWKDDMEILISTYPIPDEKMLPQDLCVKSLWIGRRTTGAAPNSISTDIAANAAAEAAEAAAEAAEAVHKDDGP